MNDQAPQEGFARRWSRLKRQPAGTDVQSEITPQTPPVVLAPADAPLVEIPPDAATIPLEDVTAWLGRNIPEGWREIALRRMWSADLSIRDFVGPADYAWDWNTPGGAPGWGPMRVADDMVRLLARAIGEDLPKVEPVAEDGPMVLAQSDDALPQAPPDEIGPEICPARGGIPESERATVQPRRGGKATPI